MDRTNSLGWLHQISERSWQGLAASDWAIVMCVSEQPRGGGERLEDIAPGGNSKSDSIVPFAFSLFE